MARRRKKKSSPLDYIAFSGLTSLSPEAKKSLWTVLLLALGLISLLSLFGLGGEVGLYFVKIMTWLSGWGKWLIPFLLFLSAWFVYQKDTYEITAFNYLGMFIFLWSFQGLLHIFIEVEQWSSSLESGVGGGRLGWSLAALVIHFFDFWVGLIAIMTLFVIGLILMFNTNLSTLFKKGAWPAKILLAPFGLFRRRLDNDKDEESEDDEEEIEDEQPEIEELDEKQSLDDSFSLRSLRDIISPRQAAIEKGKGEKVNEGRWKPSHVSIDLPLDLLDSRNSKPTAGDIKSNTEIIKSTLEKFGIPVEMGDVSVGPTVTQYTLKPDEGIKLSRITALNNDLSMSLAAHPVRIEAPIPGKSLVGIEVPNRTVATVGLREILEAKEFKTRSNNLMMALGKDVSGEVWLDSVSKMPHLLVAGATGSGKSVMLNTIIVTLLYQNNPDDLRFIMVDPKRVELTVYNGLPHLLTPVITEVSKTINALKWCLNEMDRRFETLAAAHKRDIAGYNQNAKEKMPYIVFIIDELADLMVVAAKDMEAGIVRLSQMARAVGIHLVLATQRPSVNVITGTIKANMPARIAFSVASGIDSRTILDSLGAEKLLGRGDMLFSNTSLTKPKRIQGALISDKEIKKIVDYIKERSGEPSYISEIVERQKVKGMAGVGIDGGSDDDDELFQEAKELIINSGKASASYLQRRLSIGYARAARLLDLLEESGIIGPSNGAKAREIMVSKEEYEAIVDQGVAGARLHDQASFKAPDNYLEDDEESNEDDEDEEEDEEEDKEDEEQEEEEKESNIKKDDVEINEDNSQFEDDQEEEEVEEVEDEQPEEDDLEDLEQEVDKDKGKEKGSSNNSPDFNKYYSR